jgi:hypothetical protein
MIHLCRSKNIRQFLVGWQRNKRITYYPGLPSHKVRNGVHKVPDGVHVRYKIFRNGVHLWGTEVFFKIKGGTVKHH